MSNDSLPTATATTANPSISSSSSSSSLSSSEEKKTEHGPNLRSGIQLYTRSVVTLRGSEFDSIAIMQYPTKKDFMNYAMGSKEKKTENKNPSTTTPRQATEHEDAFLYREFGLKTQGLVAMLPEVLYSADSALQARL